MGITKTNAATKKHRIPSLSFRAGILLQALKSKMDAKYIRQMNHFLSLTATATNSVYASTLSTLTRILMST